MRHELIGLIVIVFFFFNATGVEAFFSRKEKFILVLFVAERLGNICLPQTCKPLPEARVRT